MCVCVCVSVFLRMIEEKCQRKKISHLICYPSLRNFLVSS